MSYVIVRFLKGWSRPTWYEIPPTLQHKVQVGSLIVAPLRTQKVYGYVTKIVPSLPVALQGKTRQFYDLVALPDDQNFLKLIHAVADFYLIPHLQLLRRLMTYLVQTTKAQKMPDLVDQTMPKEVVLTAEQQSVVDSIAPNIINPIFDPILLHGATGSGKTEVYKALIKQALLSGKSVMYLLPEISLVVRFQDLLSRELPPGTLIFGFHSASAMKEKKALWAALMAGKSVLILGVHLPVLLPIANLGLIVVDEEHDAGFVEKQTPHIHSREMAIWRAKIYNIPIVLGSATPSVASLERVQKKEWRYFELKKRFVGTFPDVKVVKLGKPKRGGSFWISAELTDAIKVRLAKKEQVMLFLNRRGYNISAQCKGCGQQAMCPDCSVSLTFHRNKESKEESFCCHYCEFLAKTLSACKSCGKDLFMLKGVGTQRLVSLLEKAFPAARIARADLDTVKKKKGWADLATEFYRGDIDILVGTQTITKGYHFPGVTLVGVIWGDLDFSFPSYQAQEHALQQLVQVAGRAGRSNKSGSQVIVQVFTDIAPLAYLSEQNYINFFDREVEFRRQAGYPPFKRLIRIEVRSKSVLVLERESMGLVEMLEKAVLEQELDVQVLGPAQPPVFKIRGVECRHILLKADTFLAMHRAIESVDKNDFTSQLFFVPML